VGWQGFGEDLEGVAWLISGLLVCWFNDLFVVFFPEGKLKNDLKYFANIRLLEWLKVLMYGVLLFFMYRASLTYLYGKWHQEDFSYCYMIPPVVLYLIWEKRKKLTSVPYKTSWNGVLPLIFGIAIFFVGELASEFTLQFLSLWLVVVGICWVHMGWQKLKIISFPLAFSLAMFIPPNAIYAPLTLKMKLLSSELGVKMIQCYGLSAYREGNVIDLGFTQLQVVDACSGLRYVIPLLVMGILMAYYYKAAFWKKIFLVLSTIPLSIITNGLRIASVGILYQFWGPMVAEGFFHDFSGWFIFMASLAFLLLEMWLLKKIFREAEDRSQESGVRSQNSEVSPQSPTSSPQKAAGFFRPHFIVAVFLLLATVAVAHTASFEEKTPLAKPFIDFPLQVGDWSGSRQVMEQQFLDTLKLSDYTIIDFRSPAGREVNFYVAYNQSQSKGQATHSPGTCLPYSGWVFNDSGLASVPCADGMMQVSRAFMEKNGVKQLVYYWFPQRGRILTNLYQIKLYNFWDALTRHRTDGALVRIITPVYQDENPAAAEQRLQGFTRQVVPILGTFLPR
jgi:exosortase D (VPLPA-CTERM-specific)